jgi:hypothetical protein
MRIATEKDFPIKEETATFEVTLTFNSEEVWEAVTGSGFAHTKHWINFVELETWRKPCAITITHDTEEGGEAVTTIEPARLFEAFGELVKANWTHCGNYGLMDLDNADACHGDLVLQWAIFGKIIFG